MDTAIKVLGLLPWTDWAAVAAFFVGWAGYAVFAKRRSTLQPSLLDRLTDDDPGKHVEARDRSVISPQKLREFVLRDLGSLIDTGILATVTDLSEWPNAARSVINYGIPDLSGLATATLNADVLERALRQAILDFEPRILARSLRVKAIIQRGCGPDPEGADAGPGRAAGDHAGHPGDRHACYGRGADPDLLRGGRDADGAGLRSLPRRAHRHDRAGRVSHRLR